MAASTALPEIRTPTQSPQGAATSCHIPDPTDLLDQAFNDCFERFSVLLSGFLSGSDRPTRDPRRSILAQLGRARGASTGGTRNTETRKPETPRQHLCISHSPPNPREAGPQATPGPWLNESIPHHLAEVALADLIRAADPIYNVPPAGRPPVVAPFLVPRAELEAATRAARSAVLPSASVPLPDIFERLWEFDLKPAVGARGDDYHFHTHDTVLWTDDPYFDIAPDALALLKYRHGRLMNGELGPSALEVCTVDDAVPPAVRALLAWHLDSIANREDGDLHPGSDGKLQDLIHPSLHPLTLGHHSSPVWGARLLVCPFL
ncbi:hypothetical protein BDK51DRAFT_52461 [Blyttiomyces helicus]|uniref:Uncharacterized protein n=1 Tax=Blyttiomyces helicus TaxID=388810 RepID=A0A4P9WD36_9FUNG|nr:hypothetical protein BDK51DRAFT_52461 [Blyttiomyces helicus]|eukprot:RKO90252.1 hypothetical protein BDK51DRAFT_52461 [Blyttiomyces helicus]